MIKRMLIKAVREGLGRIIVALDFITRPKKVKRSVEIQKSVDSKAKALSLYQFYACPFCVKTRREIHRLDLPVALKNAQTGPHREELKQGGGKIQVPCLRIEEKESVRWMYDSKEIIRYLNQRFPA